MNDAVIDDELVVDADDVHLKEGYFRISVYKISCSSESCNKAIKIPTRLQGR